VARLSSAKAPTAVRICSVPLKQAVVTGSFSFFIKMITAEEQKFLAFWEQKRKEKRKPFAFSFGLPFSVLGVLAIFVNLLTGWHKRAAMTFGGDSSSFIVILVAGIGIIVFITVFTGRYQWEQNEQRYKELLYKKSLQENTDLSAAENESI
jgi:hypothetical protein